MDYIDLEDPIFTDPEVIKNFLSLYGYTNFKQHRNYISFGRSSESNPKAITCYFRQKKAGIIDHSRNIKGDLLGFVIKEQEISFNKARSDLLQIVEGNYQPHFKKKKSKFFGGIYPVKRRVKMEKLTILDPKILEEYECIGNKRFLQDGISIETQAFFNIGYFSSQDIITIPYFDLDGNLVGVKGRVNSSLDEKIRGKYTFIHHCKASCLLYGAYQHKESLNLADVIYVFEAEKSVMQAHTFGIYNCVALGGSAISQRQCELLISFAPKCIVFMLDEGLDMKVIKRNCRTLKRVMHLTDIPVKYWVPSNDIPSKSSPTDLGKDRFLQEINNLEVYQ